MLPARKKKFQLLSRRFRSRLSPSRFLMTSQPGEYDPSSTQTDSGITVPVCINTVPALNIGCIVFLSCAPLSPCSAAVAPRRCKEFVDYKDSVRKTCEVRLLKPSIETTRPEGLLWRSKQSSTLALQRAELFCTAQIRQQAPNGFGRPEIRIE